MKKLQSVDSAGSEHFFTPRGSFSEITPRNDQTAESIPSKVLARRESVEKLKGEIQRLKRQQSMRDKRDKDAEKHLAELREEMFKYICDLGNEILQLKDEIEQVVTRNTQTANFVHNTVLQAYSPTQYQDRRLEWVGGGERAGHAHSNPMGELMHIWEDI